MPNRKRYTTLIIAAFLCVFAATAYTFDFVVKKEPEETVFQQETVSQPEPVFPYMTADFPKNSGSIEDAYGNSVPPLYNGYSEFVGPWAFMMYAYDPGTSYKVHFVYDGYEPKAGDLLITGNPDDTWYFDEFNLRNANELRRFPYGSPATVWNGHILYILNYEDGILTCCEGNTIAPGQELDKYDPNYVTMSSIDYVQIDFNTSETLTEDKPPEKQIRVVVETDFSPSFTYVIASCADKLFVDFQNDPDSVRDPILHLYKRNINWCTLYVHYLLLMAQQVYNGTIPSCMTAQ